MGKAAKSDDGENASTLLLAYLTFSSPSNSHKSTKIFFALSTGVRLDKPLTSFNSQVLIICKKNKRVLVITHIQT